MQGKESIATSYTEKIVHETVLKKYKAMKKDGLVETLEDIYVNQPLSRIQKDNYSFTFDVLKNHIEEKMITKGKLQKILEKEASKMSLIELKQRRGVTFDNQNQLYSQNLQSGLPIFKSIIYMRYQNNDKWEQLLGQQMAFKSDHHKINVSQLNSNVPKTKLFLEDQERLNKVQFQFDSLNKFEIKDQKYPSLHDMQKRADVLAKLLLLSIFTEEHRKLKQTWRNDQNYQEMLKSQKKLKSDVQPQKLKQNEQQDIELMLKSQVSKIINSFQQKANIIAHDMFRQHNGQRAVQTKKSLQKLINTVQALPNTRDQLKMLVAYKQKKTW